MPTKGTNKGEPRSAAPRIAIAIMAAGKGTRLKSRYPKVLHHVGGKPLLAHVVAAATRVCDAQDVYAIVGHDTERVKEAVSDTGIGFIPQKEQRGTGHELQVREDTISRSGHVL